MTKTSVYPMGERPVEEAETFAREMCKRHDLGEYVGHKVLKQPALYEGQRQWMDAAATKALCGPIIAVTYGRTTL